MKVAFLTPTLTRPYPQYIASLEACLPAVEAAGFEHQAGFEVDNPYISGARASLLRRALDAKADICVFLDHDVSWRPQDMVKLLESEGDVIAGTYRFKKDPEEYMGELITDNDGYPIVRDDGCIKASKAPAGFLKVTKEAVDRFMGAYPELMYGPRYAPYVDLFNHGAIDGVWFGEDYAFCKRWIERCGELWIIPDMNIGHHSKDRDFHGNFHEFLMKQPGGSEHGIGNV